jgi:carbon-monoxide dehydrogenase medium subunit
LKARAFSYVRPTTVEDALGAYAGSGDDASYLAGGQSLVPALSLRLQAPSVLIDISHIESMCGIALENGWLRIGALTRHFETLSDPLIAKHAPLLSEAAPYVAHPAIRNKGTLGGSVALADPASEFPAMMLALGAEMEIVGSGGTRRVAADDFFVDLYQTALEPGELLVALHVPAVTASHRWAFDEMARRRGDYAIVGGGIRAEFGGDIVTQTRVVFFSVGATAIRVKSVEDALTGKVLDGETIRGAQEALAQDLDPPDDEHVPAAMRVHLARVLLGRLLHRLTEAA